jgi:threonine aldolase
MGHLGHTFLHEVGGISALGGVFPHVIQNQADGTLAIEDIQAAYREEDIHHPVSKLLILENTQNQCGGIPLSVDYMHSAATIAHSLGLQVHLDGARIFNAAQVLKVSPKELCVEVDSVMFCLSKGLCAPIGSMLCGRKDFIQSSRKIRKQLGGGMRQAGIIAAAGIYALENMINRLPEDHRRAKVLAEGLAGIPGVKLNKGYPQTNMVFFKFTNDVRKTPHEIKDRITQKGILTGLSGPDEFRLVTHRWIGDDDVEKTIAAFNEVITN